MLEKFRDQRSIIIRRLVQFSCFLVFLFILCYAVWPHGTELPSEPSPTASHYADSLAEKEWLPAELPLLLDPLLALTAFSGREMVPPMAAAILILISCLFFPRWFCGYACPLGATIDFFDFCVARHVRRWFKVRDLRHPHPVLRRLRYGILLVVLGAALAGVGFVGYVAAIPLITRAVATLVIPLQTHLFGGEAVFVPTLDGVAIASLIIFIVLLLLSFLRRRFWCRYLCPSGALYSLASMLRLRHRVDAEECNNCGRCIPACPFGAIQLTEEGVTISRADCAACKTCVAVCPVSAVDISWKQRQRDVKTAPEMLAATQPRRRFIRTSVSVACFAGGLLTGLLSRKQALACDVKLLRPPGSKRAPGRFLAECVRCGNCVATCPSGVLQLDDGSDGGALSLFSPVINPNVAGCEPSCNRCGHVCPTEAIDGMSLAEKNQWKIGLAKVDESVCLAHLGEPCSMPCVMECRLAGHDALQFTQAAFTRERLMELQNAEPEPGEGMLMPPGEGMLMPPGEGMLMPPSEGMLMPPGEGTMDELPDPEQLQFASSEGDGLEGLTIEELSEYQGPMVDASKCVGCGLCQSHCHRYNVVERKKLEKAAITVEPLPVTDKDS